MRRPEHLWRGFAGLRVVADVHGDAEAFIHAIEGALAADMFVLQLGDLTDHGPDSPEVLRRIFALIDRGQGLFLLGNHDHKLRRALTGTPLRIQPEGLGRTLAQLDAAPDGELLKARAVEEIARAPAWIRDGGRIFVHGGYHPGMLHSAPPQDAGTQKAQGLVTRALFGQVTGRMRQDGFPDRVHDWVDKIPADVTVVCGHDRRSLDGRPFVAEGALGGRCIFLDCGAGKGGHLAWIDLPSWA
ncbi:metallophosphoesterase [Falsiroseomonas tokyonensis]|uniref:Metallophosphoesterase n=1 Tax=Falsiroseomonas tokyonensis TaxID=430521 RepID=A0ABV7C0A6_9PROT|nr:metallophosphoesterase [Falsiroseomonas tokyonensis]MBU8541328.1 metallophosphoesterase [Falsiroseomonas tokyonensis]